MLHLSRALVALLLSAHLLGCGEDGYRVVVRFESPELAHDVTRLDVAVVEDCEAQDDTGEHIVDTIKSVEVRRGDTIAPFGKLEPGSFGVYGRGTSSWCQVIGLGCRQVTLEEGGRGDLVVVLKRVAGMTCDEGQECRESHCVDPGDASVDSGSDGGGDADGDVGADVIGDVEPDVVDPCGCTIDEECIPTGAIRLDQPCWACRPELDETSWSLQEQGGPCQIGGDGGSCWYVGDDPFCCTNCWLAATMTCMPATGLIWCGQGGVECFTCEGGTVCNAPVGVCEVP